LGIGGFEKEAKTVIVNSVSTIDDEGRYTGIKKDEKISINGKEVNKWDHLLRSLTDRIGSRDDTDLEKRHQAIRNYELYNNLKIAANK
jgi:hypothetical protein